VCQMEGVGEGFGVGGCCVLYVAEYILCSHQSIELGSETGDLYVFHFDTLW